MTLSVVLGAATLALSAAPPAAAASPTWNQATTLTGAGGNDPVLNNDRIDVAMGSGGSAVVGWLSGMSAGSGTVTAAYRAGQFDATWETVNLTAGASATSEPRVAVAANGDAVIAWNQSDGLYAAWRPAGIGQTWTPAHEVTPSANYAQCGYTNCPVWGFSVAIDPQGNSVVSWAEPNHNQMPAGMPYVEYRPAGATATWSAPQALPLPPNTDGSGAPLIRFGADGHALALLGVCGGYCYTRGTWGVYYYDRPQDDAAFGANSFTLTGTLLDYTLGNGYGPALDLAVGPDGSAAASWSQPYGSSYLAYRPTGAVAFDASASGDSGTVAVDPAGNALAAQGGYGASQDYYHSAGAGQAWTPVPIGPFVFNGRYHDQYVSTDVAFASTGQAVVVGVETDWVTYGNNIVAALRGSDGTWSTITKLNATNDPASSQRVATDAQGDAVAAWAEVIGGKTVVRVAGMVGGPALNNISVPATAVEGSPASFSVVPGDVWNAVADSGVTWTITNEADPSDTTTAHGASITHAFTNVGTYDVTVSAVDAAGASVTSGVHKLVVSGPPLAVAISSAGGSGAVVSATPGSSIACGTGNNVCSEPVPFVNGAPGQETLNALPDSSSYLSGWNGCVDDSQVACTVTVGPPANGTNTTVTAFFAKCPVAGTCQPFTGPDTTFSKVCPIGGTTQGGSLVTLTGKDLVSTDRFLFDGQPAAYVSGSADHTSVVVKTPAHPAGTVNVTIQGVSGATSSFTYETATPSLTGPQNLAVPYTGAGAVTLTGKNLFDISEVYSTAAISQVSASNFHASCDGTQLTFTPPDVTFLGGAGSIIAKDDILVTTANGTNSDFYINRTLPYTQDGGQVINGLTPDWVDALPVSESTQAFTDSFPDNNGGTIDVNVPAGALPTGTVLNLYSGSGTAVASQMPSGVTVLGGYAVAWSAPDGSHPAATKPIVITIHDPTIKPSDPVYTGGGGGGLTPLPVSHTVTNADDTTLFVSLDDNGNVLATFALSPGETVLGGQVIAAGGGNVIAAGGGNVIAGGGGNFTLARLSRNALVNAMGAGVIAAGGGNVIAAGGGNVIAAGGGNIISTLLNSAAVIAAGGGNVIAAGGGNIVQTGAASEMWALNDGGSLTIGMPADPEFVLGTPPVPPGPAGSVSATAVGKAASVSWTAPAPVSPAVTGYAVQVFDGPTQVDNAVFGSPATTESITGLIPGHSYTFTVEAFNGGYGAASTPSNAVIISTPSVATGAPSGTAGTWQAAGSTFASSSSPPSPSAPVVVRVTTPAAGDVAVSPAAPPQVPTGYQTFGPAEHITAPSGSATAPLVIGFDIDRSALPGWTDDTELTVTRDGVPAGSCAGATTITAVDPCVASVVDHGSYLTVTVLSTHASTWAEAAPTADRIAGSDRVGTAVAASQAYFAPWGARAAVLARDDDYADALAGGPLASSVGGPLLLTPSGELPGQAAAELTRVLPPGASVYVLGGQAAVSDGVATAVTALGFSVHRVAGADRYATAADVADLLGQPTTVLLASGTNFPDALAAGAAASFVGAAVLLTDGPLQAGPSATWLAAHPGTRVYAVGGPAAQADPAATPVVGTDRYGTAVAVAEQFFPSATAAGLASGLGYADALSAGPLLGVRGEPLVLTDPSLLTPSTGAYLARINVVHTFGGTAAVAFGPGAVLRSAVRAV